VHPTLAALPGLMRTGSPDNALFSGDHRSEHAWFTIADSLPVLSMDAQRAAAAIVRAGLRGRPEIILTPAAKLAVRAHGVLPGVTQRVLSLVDRMLPRDDTGTNLPGYRAAPEPAWLRWVTSLTRDASRRWHQLDDRIGADGRPGHSATH
jgi:hypothetical protein